MPPGVIDYHHYHDQKQTVQQQDSFLQSVKEQEAQFERLTRELEAERQKVAHKVHQYRIGSETESMNSISSTDDTFQWGGPQDDSLRYGDESHGLMDSCLQELEHRGTMNFGEDNMNYMPEDPYNSSGPGPYTSGDYHSYNGGPHHDINSVHSSHVSLQSNGSNRHNPRQMKLGNPHIGSHSSLPYEQQQQHPSDNYAPYSSLPQRNYDDYRGSPLPSNGSPRGPGTPTRFTNNYDDYAYDHQNSPNPQEPNVSYGYGEQESFENPMQQHPPQLDSSYQYDSYRGPPPDDRYPPQDDRYPNQVEDSFYRQSPLPDNRYAGGPDRYQGGQDPRDNYMDHPGDGYRDDDSLRDHPDTSFQGQPDFIEGPPLDRYGQPLMEGYPGQPANQHPDMKYVEPLDDSYRGQPEDSFRGQQDDSFRDQPPNNRFHDISDDGYRQDIRDGYRGDPNNRYEDQPTNHSFQQDPLGNSYHDNMPPNEDMYMQDNRRHDGLPQVQDDPFANDPFPERQRSLQHLRDEENYPREPSPREEGMGPGSYMDRPPQYDHMDGQPPYPEDGSRQLYDDDMVTPLENQMLRAPPDDFDDGRRTPSTQGGTMRWRSPDLQEIIDYLSHPSDSIKANAAAYLTHLSYMDDNTKQKVGALRGIPPLVELLNSEFPEVHKNACGALKNLTYGRNNRENKKALMDARGVPALVRLLRKTQDDDVKDCVTGVLWNLSSVDKFKKPIIDDGLAVLVNSIVIPYSGWERRSLSPYQAHEPWTTIFRNASGVLRNISSAGPEARKRLRECHGLVESFVFVVRTGIDQNNIENKAVENCTCTLRNLAFRIQEVENPEFYKTRNATLQRQKQPDKGEKVGCFGGGGNKKKEKKNKGDVDTMPDPSLPQSAQEYMGLWAVDTVRYFLQLLSGANPITLEAACGALQNLTACDWKPAVSIRALVRKEKGLPSLVDLMTFEVERVVCAAAIALRNLSIDERNRELVGKYAMKQLISNLPHESRPSELQNETISAVLACLNEVLASNPDFASTFCNEAGLPRVMTITRNQQRFEPRTVKFAVAVLKNLWSYKMLHQNYKNVGLTEKDFHPAVLPRDGQANSNLSTPYNTISRPMQGQGYDDTTLSSRKGNNYSHMGSDPRMVQGHSNPMLDQPDRHMYGSKQGRLDEIPMNDIGPGYAPIDEQQRNQRNKPPVGGVALFPNLPPDELSSLVRKHSQKSEQENQQEQSEESLGQQPGGGSPNQEPLYARVNKKRSREEMGSNPVLLGQDQGQEGADSWV